jgi:hypothetical protein
MTLPHGDTSNVSDPGSMNPEVMTQPGHETPGDLTAGRDRSAHPDRTTGEDRDADAGAAGPDAVGSTGAPLGPPD